MVKKKKRKEKKAYKYIMHNDWSLGMITKIVLNKQTCLPSVLKESVSIFYVDRETTIYFIKLPFNYQPVAK